LLQLGHGISPVETGAWTARHTSPLPSFNWATEFLPWKPPAKEPTIPRLPGFNWATEFLPWKQKARRRPGPADRGASIGPRNFSRGNNTGQGPNDTEIT